MTIRVRAAGLLLMLVGCAQPPGAPAPDGTKTPPLRSFPAGVVRDSVFLPVDRSTAPPPRYGLYTVLLTRAANRNSARLLSALFESTGIAGEATLARENLNLIMIPVRHARDAAHALGSVRHEPEAAAGTVMRRFYDFGEASRLISEVCRPQRGAEVMRVCGPALPDGPLLVTSQRPLDGRGGAGERLLIVNLSLTPAEAVPEVVAAYRRQVLRRNFDDRDEMDAWRLQALNHLISAARLLPGIGRAYAVSH